MCPVLLKRVDIPKVTVLESSQSQNTYLLKEASGAMDLAQQAKIIDSIHDTLNDFVGMKLRVKANMGRSKIVESVGTLTQVHPKLFIMEMDRKRGRTARQSYQYVDVLTGMVELSQDGEPIFEPFIIESESEMTLMMTDTTISATSTSVEKQLLP